MAIRKGIFKVRNTATGEKDEVMLKTTIEQVADLDKLTGATANAAGVWGLAPAPTKGSQNLPLCGDAKYKVLPVEGGGTGANTVAAVQALLGSAAVGSSTKSIYYDGETLKACADSIGGGGIVAALLEQNGYVKFANGLILQWGIITSSIKELVTVTFPLAMSNTYAIYRSFNQKGNLSDYGSGLEMSYWVSANITGTSFDVRALSDSRVATTVWMAIGI